MTSGFSKVSVVDDDDERLEVQRRAFELYDKAQAAYARKGSQEDVLRLFEEAEAAMRPLLGGGLASLDPAELETVLKGRLHQAVSLAQLSDPGRWVRVKSLAEDVLQFDFNNAHARWLRGLALQHGNKKSAEAQEECRRAVECARAQGKEAEAAQWEAEVRHTFEAEVPRTPKEGKKAPEAPETLEKGEKEKGEKEKAKATMAKGFLNKPKKPSQPAPPADKEGLKEKEAKADMAREAARREAVREAEQGFQAKEAELQRQLAQAAAELQEHRRRMKQEAEQLLAELEPQMQALSESLGAAPHTQQVTEKVTAGRAWAEKEQQRFVEVSTELLTLQQMTVRELKDQQDSTSKHCGELRDLARRCGELAKSSRQLEALMSTSQDMDLPRLAQHVADFHQLPRGAKLAALLDDGAVLLLLGFCLALGMLFMPLGGTANPLARKAKLCWCCICLVSAHPRLAMIVEVTDVLRLSQADTSQVRSFGSLLHSCRTEAPCRPCMFERVPGRCKKAWLCDFCHLHSGRKRKGNEHLLKHKTKKDMDKATKELIKAAMKQDRVCAILENQEVEAILSTMEYFQFTKGSLIVEQGKMGTTFFVTHKGTLEVSVNGNVVNTLVEGQAFGGLALLYNCPRTATVKAMIDAGAWGANGHNFKQVLAQNAANRQADNLKFLDSIKIFDGLNQKQKDQIALAAFSESFDAGQRVATQGESLAAIYFVKRGGLSVMSGGEVKADGKFEGGTEAHHLSSGEYIGAALLLSAKSRPSWDHTLLADAKTELLCISAKDLKEILGNDLAGILETAMVQKGLRMCPVMSQFSSTQRNDIAKAIARASGHHV
ncbi:unnamed protein product [Effrenium voratum]|nr:unnamed protein product [Effrenium voratum]